MQCKLHVSVLALVRLSETILLTIAALDKRFGSAPFVLVLVPPFTYTRHFCKTAVNMELI